MIELFARKKAPGWDAWGDEGTVASMNKRIKIFLAFAVMILAMTSFSTLPREPERTEVMAITEETPAQEQSITETPEPQEPA